MSEYRIDPIRYSVNSGYRNDNERLYRISRESLEYEREDSGGYKLGRNSVFNKRVEY